MLSEFISKQSLAPCLSYVIKQAACASRTTCKATGEVTMRWVVVRYRSCQIRIEGISIGVFREYHLLIVWLSSSYYFAHLELFRFGDSCSNLGEDNNLKARPKGHQCCWKYETIQWFPISVIEGGSRTVKCPLCLLHSWFSEMLLGLFTWHFPLKKVLYVFLMLKE